MNERFEQFLRERQYLKNVSVRTLGWYGESFKWLADPEPSEQRLRQFVVEMRQKGLKASSCNARIRAVNAYLHWASDPDGKCGSGCTHLRVPKLKEEERILPTFSIEDIGKFCRWSPQVRSQKRVKALITTLADTGCRISEALALKWSDVDWDSMLLTLHGKGRKDRRVPFSFELRRVLFRLQGQNENRSAFVFCTRDGGQLSRNNTLRSVKRVCRKLNITIPERTQHAFRHSFALNYLRQGGSTLHLQKCLGHSSLEMTRRYANLTITDLQAVHEKVSLLAAARAIRRTD